MASNEEVIRMLNEDLKGEIEAILTYVKHFAVIKECKISRETEEISLDEMRHVEWLASAVVDLGGEPAIDHMPLNFGGNTVQDMLRRDVELEKGAVKQYGEHIVAIDDPKLKKLLTKIKSEEEEHLSKFSGMLEEIS